MDHDHETMDHSGHREEHGIHASHSDPHAGHDVSQGAPADQTGQAGHQGHGAHTADHTGHEQMFRNRFWVMPGSCRSRCCCTARCSRCGSASPCPRFPAAHWIAPVFAIIVFVYGGVPFLQMAVPELRNRQPGMMTLISLAITVAFVYSLVALVLTRRAASSGSW